MTSANWALGSPAIPYGDYGNAANWNTYIVPNEVATFGQSNMLTVFITSALSVGGWSIYYQSYNFVALSSVSFNDQGIQGGTGSQFSNSANLSFNNSASAGISGTMVFHNNGTINFANSSSAGYAIFDNAGYLHFANKSTAANSLISVTKTGTVDFTEGATAGAATLITAAEGNQIGRINFKGDGPAHNHKLTAGSFSGNGIFDLSSNQVTVGNDADTTVDGRIIGTGDSRLIKVGDGEMTLNGINSYGGTVINGGTLTVNGVIGNVTLVELTDDQSATLYGKGVVGNVTAKSGYVSGGVGVFDPGQLRTGTLDIQARSQLAVDIRGISVPGTEYDQFVVTGKVKLAGALTTQVFGEFAHGQKITIIDNDGKDKVSGTFSGGSLFGRLVQGDRIVEEFHVLSISYKGGTGNDVVLKTEGNFSYGTGGDDTINLTTAANWQYSRPTTNFADAVVAGPGNDTIDTGAGHDSVAGGTGKDVLNGGKGNDMVSFYDATASVKLTLNGSKQVTVKIGGVAEDKIKNFENIAGSEFKDKLTGDGGDNVLQGAGGNDILKGGKGNDALVGDEGKDVLEGGSGKDIFVFEQTGAQHADTVKDFHHGQDRIMLDEYDFRAIGAKLDASEFYAAPGAAKAHARNDHIVYDTRSGELYYDADGKGGDAGILFAKLSGHPSLSHGDFIIA